MTKKNEGGSNSDRLPRDASAPTAPPNEPQSSVGRSGAGLKTGVENGRKRAPKTDENDEKKRRGVEFGPASEGRLCAYGAPKRASKFRRPVRRGSENGRRKRAPKTDENDKKNEGGSNSDRLPRDTRGSENGRRKRTKITKKNEDASDPSGGSEGAR